MSSFVYDALTPPDGKTNARNLVGPAAQSVTAEEWNAVMQYLEDIRTAIISGDYSGLTEFEAPVSGASAARLRVFENTLQASVNGGAYFPLTGSGFFNVRDFGAVGDGVTDDIAAFDAAIEAMHTFNPAIAVAPGNTLVLPPGKYLVSRPIQISRGMVLQGSGAGQGAINAATHIVGAPGKDVIVVHRYSTSKDGGRGDRSVIRDLSITQSSLSGTGHGIRMFARAAVYDCVIENVSGNGVHIEAQNSAYIGTALPAWAPSTAYAQGDMVFNDGDKWYVCRQAGTSAGSGGPTGTTAYPATVLDGTCRWGYSPGANANGWVLQNLRIMNTGKNGVYVKGADANAGLGSALDIGTAGEWGIWDDSFLGNTWVGCQVADGVLGPYRCDGASAQSIFIGNYAESGQPPSLIGYPSTFFGGLNAAGESGNATGIRHASVMGRLRMPVTSDGSDMTLCFGENVANGSMMDLRRASDSLVSSLKCMAAGAIATQFPNCVYWDWGNTGPGWGWAHNSLAKLGMGGGSLARSPLASSLFTAVGAGILNEGVRISHADDPTTLTGGPVLLGDLVFRRTPVAGGFAGWVCSGSGTNGTYSEGRTATTTGTTSVTLDSATHYRTGIRVGDTLTIGGVTSRVLDMNDALTVLTMSATQGTGAAQAITFSAPTFTEFGPIVGTASDSTGTPGAATQNTRTGRVAIAAGANSVTVTNSKVSATSIVTAVLQTVDATLTSLPVVVCSSGSFTVYGNANATAACSLGWVLQ